jgi:hypothetical protein
MTGICVHACLRGEAIDGIDGDEVERVAHAFVAFVEALGYCADCRMFPVDDDHPDMQEMAEKGPRVVVVYGEEP